MKSNTITLLLSAGVGFLAGYLVFDHSIERRELKAEADKYKAEASALRQKHKQAVKASSAGVGTRKQEATVPPALSPAEKEIQFAQRPKEKVIAVRDMMASNRAEARRAGYTKVFAELGFSAEKSDELQNELKDITWKALASEGATVDLLDAKQKYQKELKKTLTPEQYDRYLDFEKTRPALAEFDRIQKYLTAHQSTFPTEHQDTFIQLLKQRGSFTDESIDGPFDAVPRPTLGEDCIPVLEEQKRLISENAKAILERSSQIGIPDETRGLVAGFYSEKLKQLENALELVRMPWDVKIQVLQQRMEERRRKSRGN